MPRLLLLVLLLPGLARAQSAREADGPPRLSGVSPLSDAAEVSLLTMLPGDEVYSLFGHTAFRVRDPALGLDRTYNYGTFDFDQPGFVLRFMRGQLLYQLAAAPYGRTLAEYRYLERPIIEQRLALPPEAEQDLFAYLETNLLPENRAYRYDFLFDNCSTRPRDVLEQALGERLSFGGYRSSPLYEESTFRALLQPYLEGDPLLDFGIDLGLAEPVDRHAQPREAMFLPLELMRAFDAATLDGRPLVAARDTVFWVEGAGLPEAAPDWPRLVLWLLLGLGVLMTVLGRLGRLGAGVLRWFDVGLLVVAGLVGLILALLWFATEHAVTARNWNLLWAWPTHLAAAGFVRRQNLRPALRVYLGLAAGAALMVAVFGPWLPQAFHPAVVPLALLVALRAADRALSPPVSAAEPA